MLRLGTRGSRLALVQSELVADRLRRAGHEVELVPVVTAGDVRPVDTAPGEGMFVGELAAALLAGEVDLAVHSAKDLPLEQDPRLVVAAYPERADARDALVTRDGGATLDTLPAGSLIGTDSPRRAGFLLAARPDLRVGSLHGNVDTRLRRLDEGQVDALLIAAAGVERLGLAGRIDERLDVEVVAPAPGQGSLAVQVRADSAAALAAVGRLDDPEVRLTVETERRLLGATGGGCRAPVGALAELREGTLHLLAAAVTPEGLDLRLVRIETSPEGAAELAWSVGRKLRPR